MKKECIDTIVGKSYVGDWFLFYLLGQNIDSVIFKVLDTNFKGSFIGFLFISGVRQKISKPLLESTEEM